MNRNRLDQETSPYLLQHKDNPVHWQPWDVDAFAAARASGRPILLSVGYAACHWCHVMAHESFEDPDTARLLNDVCISIKVDREERPDVDAIYQSALAMMGEQGGWPLTMFLTPEGVPFWGGTYFPPTSRYGRPAFRDVVLAVVDAYRQEPHRVAESVSAMTRALDRMSQVTGRVALSLDLFDRAAFELVNYVDMVHGGLQGAPKFPQFPVFEFLWRAWRRGRDPRVSHAVLLTLEHICEGGIYDHVGGGLARYSTDEVWLVPHFEKMLYDNAQFIDLLTTVWQDTRRDLFARRIEETVAWLRREMVADPGAFAASLDADSAGEEGRFYVWSAAEVDALLGNDAPTFRDAYGVTAQGNWEGTNVLNRTAGRPAPSFGADPALEAVLDRCRARLLTARAKRIPPARDDKVLADWNGLTIQALARAGSVFGRPEWVTLAARAFATVRDQMTLPGSDGRLGHSLRRGRLQHTAVLDDYAAMAWAALALLEATGDPAYLNQAEHWVSVANQHYWDDRNGGYFFTADDATDLITRTRSPADNAVPAGNGVMAKVLGRLHAITGNPAHRERAEAIFHAFSGALADRFPYLATLMNAYEQLAAQTLVVVVGPPAEAEALRAVAVVEPVSDLVVLAGPPDSPLVMGRTAAADGSAAAYVCRQQTCAPPVSTADALVDVLASRSMRADSGA